MRATTDVVLGNPHATPDDLRGMAADIRAAVDHAEHLIGALLLLARNERGLTVREEVDLATAAEDVLDSADLSDRQAHATLEPAAICGDPVLAERLIVASIAAIHGGTVTAWHRDGGGLTVTVTFPAAVGTARLASRRV